MREKSASSKRHLKSISQSTMSLNSLGSDDDNAEVRKESRPQSVELSADSIVRIFYFFKSQQDKFSLIG